MKINNILYKEYPFTLSQLDKYRLKIHRRMKIDQIGAHMLRHKGQSLEFLEFRRYIPGDDYSAIDWVASARYGLPHEKIIRSFSAEKRMTLVVSIDNSETMQLPNNFPKISMAIWLATTLTAIARLSDDRVFIHRLFGVSHGLQEIKKTINIKQIMEQTEKLMFKENNLELNAGELSAILHPTTVWVIITDLYFQHSVKELIKLIRKAQAAYCWLIIVDLDTWSYEKQALLKKPYWVIGPGLTEKMLTLLNNEAEQAVYKRIKEHKNTIYSRIKQTGYSKSAWHWPAQTNIANFFKEQFLKDKILMQLFQKNL